jgi:hypothetical protein
LATYFVASGGSNTAPYDTWAKASTSLQTALTAATSAGDIIVIQYNAVPSGDAELAADTTYTTGNSCQIISASNDGGSSYTPTAMGTANWIGNSTANRSITVAGADDSVYIYGVTFRTASSPARGIVIGGSIGQAFRCESCYFWAGNTASTTIVVAGTAGSSIGVFTEFVNCTFRAGATGQSIRVDGTALFVGCTVSSSGSTPTTLLAMSSSSVANHVTFSGCDLSLVTGTLVGNFGNPYIAVFDRCILGAGVTVLAAQSSNPTRSSASAYLFDCSSGDTHGLFGYYDALGSVVSDTGIYFTSGAAAQSWKIVTTANAGVFAPFVTPLVSYYNSGTSAITPYFEILRDGSTTAYNDNAVWAEFSAKTTTSSTKATFSSDKGTGSAQANGVGLGSWTGESGTAWSGKCDSGSSITPAEVGAISGSIYVAAASTTLYVDPQIRT